jgi:hypothetical protein
VLGALAVTGITGYVLSGSKLIPVTLLVVGVAMTARQIGVLPSLGLVLLLMPMQWLVIALLQFNAFAHYQEVSALKELIFLAAVLWLVMRDARVAVVLPDVLLLGALILVAFEQLFHFDPKGLRDDWEWALLYALGRVLILSPEAQALWAKCAVWMCAFLSVLAAWEVLFLGPQFRLLLLRQVEGNTLGRLPPPFLANGYTGMRAASTMVSPLSFSALCMIALVLWWTYMKNPIPAALIAMGLALTVTRSATVGAVLGVLVVGIRRHESKRVALFLVAFVVAVLIAVPSLDLKQYLRNTVTSGADTSSEAHETSLAQGIGLVVQNPLGTGAGTVTPRNLAKASDAISIEDSYLTIALEYGLVCGVLYLCFFGSCVWMVFKLRTPLGYASFSVLVSFGLLLAVGPLHLDIPLASWVWVLVGMAVTQSRLQIRHSTPQAMPI